MHATRPKIESKLALSSGWHGHMHDMRKPACFPPQATLRGLYLCGRGVWDYGGGVPCKRDRRKKPAHNF